MLARFLNITKTERIAKAKFQLIIQGSAKCGIFEVHVMQIIDADKFSKLHCDCLNCIDYECYVRG